ncbi:hypothetical protein MYAM1_002396 [Malassezia yamatoensis]|uniref:BOD1/SHG1 domain-containing protein n=1 Tax=Malassezia yamatoensis TaxID=253288 RepID=A0AAJ5YVU2_9BASI|nr:hypothetical protein MYAM1_002396 [Malassezia yamatoensis]
MSEQKDMSETPTSSTLRNSSSEPGSSAYAPSFLVEEFKRQGQFDQIRKRILQEFQQSGHYPGFLQQAEESMLRFVESHADRLVFRDARLRHSDLMRELDQNPLLDQLVENISQQPNSAEIAADPAKPALLGQHCSTAYDIRQQIHAMVQAEDAKRAAESADG